VFQSGAIGVEIFVPFRGKPKNIWLRYFENALKGLGIPARKIHGDGLERPSSGGSVTSPSTIPGCARTSVANQS
ncbi:MAG: hypothetical protein ACO3NW_01730, partial [Kiritimatiellia bacterium]